MDYIKPNLIKDILNEWMEVTNNVKWNNGCCMIEIKSQQNPMTLFQLYKVAEWNRVQGNLQWNHSTKGACWSTWATVCITINYVWTRSEKVKNPYIITVTVDMLNNCSISPYQIEQINAEFFFFMTCMMIQTII